MKVAHTRIFAILILILIACMGVWLGEFGWFGGYQSTQQALAISSLVLSFVGAGFVCQKRWLSLLTVPLYFIFSQVLFIVFWALGQTFYFNPSPGEFNEVFWQALHGAL